MIRFTSWCPFYELLQVILACAVWNLAYIFLFYFRFLVPVISQLIMFLRLIPERNRKRSNISQSTKRRASAHRATNIQFLWKNSNSRRSSFSDKRLYKNQLLTFMKDLNKTKSFFYFPLAKDPREPVAVMLWVRVLLTASSEEYLSPELLWTSTRRWWFMFFSMNTR